VAEQHNSGSANGRPLIIAGGFFPVPVPLGHIAAIYAANGFDVRIIPFDLRNKLDVRVYAQSIAELARQAHQETSQRADIIGLSMGGVAALYAIKFLGAGENIHTSVAIGSPFYGSPVAEFWSQWPRRFNLSARQMSPGSDLLKQLREAPLPEGPRFVSLGGIFDVVSPAPTTQLDDAENYLWFFGHHDLMFLGWLHFEVIKLLL